MKYLKTSQMGVSSIQTLKQAQDELAQFLENAMPKDVLETMVVEMSEPEFEALPEFNGY
jgi:hypothetical protein